MTIGLVDLARQRAAIEPRLTEAFARVAEHGAFIGGPEVAALEAALAARVGIGHAVGCANGTDALQLLLRAAGIGAGDAVFVPSLTFVATVEAVMLAGAMPMLIDVDPATGTMCPNSLQRSLSEAASPGRPRAVIAVDLFSLPADHAGIGALAAQHGLLHFVDAAHSIGTETPDGACGALAAASTTSFYPSKALGCYGDGGAVFVRDADLAARLRAVANHGQSSGQVGQTLLGTNSRLDTIQAAILLEKLAIFDVEVAARRRIAARYQLDLAPFCNLPAVAPGVRPVWSYFAIRHPRRDALQAHLKARGIASVAYYRVPTHAQPAYAELPVAPGGLPITEAFAANLLCLPLHPYLTESEVDQVVAAVVEFGA
jgi:dTDP-4-amino-4,6-dideoxygalactose transaminase